MEEIKREASMEIVGGDINGYYVDPIMGAVNIGSFRSQRHIQGMIYGDGGRKVLVEVIEQHLVPGA